jgi:hypothetical protein
MEHDQYLHCQGNHGTCGRKVARSKIENAVTSEPKRSERYKVPLGREGEWHAYRGLDGRVDSVFCSVHADQGRTITERMRD